MIEMIAYTSILNGMLSMFFASNSTDKNRALLYLILSVLLFILNEVKKNK